MWGMPAMGALPFHRQTETATTLLLSYVVILARGNLPKVFFQVIKTKSRCML